MIITLANLPDEIVGYTEEELVRNVVWNERKFVKEDDVERHTTNSRTGRRCCHDFRTVL